MRVRLSALYRLRRQQSARQHGNRLRRHPRKPAIRRRRHQLLDPPVDSVRRRRPRRSSSTAATACSNDLRSSKDEGQSNFNNPGTVLLGVGADFDVLPRAADLAPTSTTSGSPTPRWSRRCASRARFSQRSRLGLRRWRRSGGPGMTQNIVFRAVRRGARAGQPASTTCSPIQQRRPAIIPSCFNADPDLLGARWHAALARTSCVLAGRWRCWRWPPPRRGCSAGDERDAGRRATMSPTPPAPHGADARRGRGQERRLHVLPHRLRRGDHARQPRRSCSAAPIAMAATPL